MNILKTARNLSLRLKAQGNAKQIALTELQRIVGELDALATSNAPPVWQKRRRAQLLFEQATAQRFLASCR